MYDNYEHLLSNFEAKNKSVLNSIKGNLGLRFSQRMKQPEKKSEIDLEKWKDLQGKLKGSQFADFNV